MKSKKITFAVSLMLAVVMLFSTFSVAAVNDFVPTTQIPETTVVVPTTEPATDGEHSDDYYDGYWDGYYDAMEDLENEDYNSGYEDGYYDGLGDGYEDGYYEGYFDGIQDFEEPTIFEKIEDFFFEFQYRIEEFFERIINFFQMLFKTGDYAEPTYPENNTFIPDGTQPNLDGNEEVAALCTEFNNLIENSIYISEPVAITKNVNVDVVAKDIPAAVQGIANEIIDSFTGETSVTNDYVAGDEAYTVQPTFIYPAGLASAEKTVNEDGTTDYKFVVVAEAAFYNGFYTYGVKLENGNIVPTELQHDSVADTILIEAADLGPVTITSAEIYYPGATITAKTDANGRLINYDISMPVSGTGTAKIALINVVANIEGCRDEGFVFTYAN